MRQVWRDTLYALRLLRQRPAFTATAVLTLALAIGGNTAMFTVIRAVLLKPLAYPEPDRLVRISGGAAPARFEEIETEARSYTAIGAFTGMESVTLAGRPEPEVLPAARVSANFLQILGLDPLLGRGFLPAEDRPGGPPVAMIGAELWQRRFNGDSQIVGKTVNLSGTPYTIVGVLPPRFQFPSAGVDVWMTAPAEWPLMPPKSRALSPFLTVFGRLKPRIDLEQANAEMKVIQRRYALAHPAMLDAKPKSPVRVTPMKDVLVANVRSMLWMLFGAVGFVLLIACANVANLLLVRANSRSREFAVRAALGAARSRLVRQLLAESILLSSAGGLMGVLLAWWSLRAIPSLPAFDLPRAANIHLDWIVLGFAAALSLSTGVLFGLAPALGASRPDLIRVLRAAGGAAGEGIPRRILPGLTASGALVVGQVALSIVLLIGAALLMQSVANLRGASLGFNPANLLTTRISLPLARYDTDRKTTAFFDELLRRVNSTPGVRAAAAANVLPMMEYPGTPVQEAAKPPLKLNERPIATILTVTPGYFRTLRIAIARGRDFSERDTAGAPRVAIVDETLVRLFWPAYPGGKDVIGQRLLVGGVNPQPAEIVGIVPHVHQTLEDATWPQTVYVSFAQAPQQSAMLAIRTAGDPLRFTRTIREQVRSLDREQPLAAVHTMDDLVDAETGQRRLILTLLASFAAVAVLLALIGMYGLIAYSVAQRTHELAIRRALGARESDVLRLIVGHGFALALAGAAIGVGGALALTRVMKSLLFHVSATDPTTFAALALSFLAIAVAASYIPARRGLRIDPLQALRL